MSSYTTVLEADTDLNPGDSWREVGLGDSPPPVYPPDLFLVINRSVADSSESSGFARFEFIEYTGTYWRAYISEQGGLMTPGSTHIRVSVTTDYIDRRPYFAQIGT